MRIRCDDTRRGVADTKTVPVRCPRAWATLFTAVSNVVRGRGQRCPWARTTKHTVSCNEKVARRKGNRGHNNNNLYGKVDTFYRQYSPRHLSSTGVRQTNENATCSVFFKIDKSEKPRECVNECSGESLLFEVKTEKLGEMWNAFATLNRLSYFQKIRQGLKFFFRALKKVFQALKKNLQAVEKIFPRLHDFLENITKR